MSELYHEDKGQTALSRRAAEKMLLASRPAQLTEESTEEAVVLCPS